MDLQKGQKIKLSQLSSLPQFTLTLSASLPGSTVDISCFGVDSQDKLSDDRYFIFYNQPTSPEGAISMTAGNQSTTFAFDLSRLPSSIHKLVITLAADGPATMQSLTQGTMSLAAAQQTLAQFAFDGSQFTQEKALILAEIYLKDGTWRLSVVASGFNGGLSALLAHFGGEEIAPSTQAPAPSAPSQVHSGPVNLKKQGDSHSINLAKNSSTLHVNLNWQTGLGGLKGVLGGGSAIDLDLACMYRLKDGQASVIQALGNSFGAKDRPPYILLDQDDRTGASTNGENMWFYRPELLDFAVVFAYIYDGTPNWKNTGAVVTLKQQGSPDIVIQIDNRNTRDRFCVIASLTGSNGQLQVRREEKFFPGHREVDQAYGFGFLWRTARK